MDSETKNKELLDQLKEIDSLDYDALLKFYQNVIKSFLNEKATNADVSNITLYMIIENYNKGGLENVIPQILFCIFNLLKGQHEIIKDLTKDRVEPTVQFSRSENNGWVKPPVSFSQSENNGKAVALKAIAQK